MESLQQQRMSLITTIATGKKSAAELKCLIQTLEMFESGASLYIFTDSETAPIIPASTLIRIQKLPCLDEFSGKTRAEMEALPGKNYKSMWSEFMIQKAFVLKWALEDAEQASKKGVWFLDSDIALFAPLPVYAAPKTLALSPHYIRPADERKFGHFNGGMLWIRDVKHLDDWKWATLSSRFYEQSALEDVWNVCPSDQRIEMPPQVNLGWWRHGQSVEAPPEIEKKLGFQRQPGCMGLKYEGFILQSVHTHWYEQSLFNAWIRNALQKIQKTHDPAKRFLQALTVLEKSI
jgi:hypothetical protein